MSIFGSRQNTNVKGKILKILKYLREEVFISLRLRLLLLLLITIVPFTMLIIYEMHEITDYLVAETQKENMTLARQVADTIDEYIVSTGEILQAITNNQHTRRQDFDSMNRWFRDIVLKYRYYSNMTYIDNEGYVRVSAVSKNNDKPVNVRESSYYERAMNSDSLTIGDFTYSPFTGDPVIHICYPVYDLNDRRQGFVAIALDLTKIQNRLFQMKLPETVLVTVIDKNGIMVARSQQPESWVGKNMSNETPFRRMVGKDSGTDKVKSPDGKVRIIAFTQVSKTGWYVRVGMDESEVNTKVWKELNIHIMIFIPIFLIAFFGWLWIGLDLENLHRKLQHLSLIDSLTQVWNGRKFNTDLEVEYQRARRYNKKLSFAMIDLDSFKNCNDTFGHLFGDDCLIAIADLIKKSIRKVDLLYRYGGDEFSILMPETDAQEAYTVLERVRNNLAKFQIKMPRGGSFKPITASIGYSTYPDNSLTPEELIRNADHALYGAKTTGRNKTVSFDSLLQSV